MNLKSPRLLTVLLATVFLMMSHDWLRGAAVPVNLQCEYQAEPVGIDVSQPELNWQVRSDERGQRQSAFEILVASSEDLIRANQGDLWDSGKVISGETVNTAYAGKPLSSGAQCFWKVRIWDKNGQESEWSRTASWSMGLLHRADWTAEWISDPILADPANRPMTPVQCYRSELASRPDAVKWIVLDLGSSQRMDAMDMIPARPQRLHSDFRTVMFPLRFKLEASDNRDFSHAQLLVDNTSLDFPSPRKNSCRFQFPPARARYVRLTVTRLACWDGHDYGVALGGLVVFDGPKFVDVGAGVECSDSIESGLWSKKFLVNGATTVTLAPDAAALDPEMPDTTKKFTVSRVPMLRREFNLAGKVRRATLSVSARGFYEVRINGQRVGDELLAPGYTDYGVRLQYRTCDVTSLLQQGTNAIGALLGYGWYAGHMNLFEMRCIYGYFPQLIAQLDVDLVDGTHVRLGTDGQWRSTLDGPVRWSDLLDGEGYDCRREIPGWDQPGFDDHAWQSVWSQPRDEVPLVWHRSPPVRIIREFAPVGVKEVKPGVHVFDLGQEITGWCRLKVDGPAGTHVRLRHAEMIASDGNIDVGSLMGTLQEEDYILDGKGEHTLEPHFTYHGFRYVELSGVAGPLKADTLTAVNVRTDAAVAGRFKCSNELYNQIQSAAAWTEANLLFDVPAGCAARAERLAWMGDIRPCVQSLLFNYDTAPLLEKYVTDMRDDQAPDGRFTDIAPQAHLRGTTTCVGSPGWADAGVSLPWEVYVNTGNKRLLAEHFEAARRWVDVIYQSNPNFLWQNNRGMDWGDWMSAGVETPRELGATAFFAHSAYLVSRMAAVLGRQDEAKHYQALFQGIRQAFVKNYVNAAGIIGGNEPGHAVMRDVSDVVRSLTRDGELNFLVNNDVLGGDPAFQKIKNLHIIVRQGNETQERVFVEGSKAEIGRQNNRPAQIISAAYGYDGIDLGDTQGSYALALHFGLLDEPLRSLAAKRLDQLVVAKKYHPTTGFWSSVEVLLALSENGYHGDAAEMLNQRDEPSWGYMAEYNTTFWEAFNANSRSLSLNHWTHSAASEWLWRDVAGLNPTDGNPGYGSFTLRPRPSREVKWCQASYDSICGQIVSDWKWDAPNFALNVTVPPNTTATVYLPATDFDAVTESGKPAARSQGVTFLRAENGLVILQVESGSYQFVSKTISNLF